MTTDAQQKMLILERADRAMRYEVMFDEWRSVVLYVSRLFLWKRKFYPLIIFSLTSALFAGISYVDGPLLSTVGVIMWTMTVAEMVAFCYIDYIEGEWTIEKQREYVDVCKAMANVTIFMRIYSDSMQDFKDTYPLRYYAITMVFYAFVAYIGGLVDNILIAYIVTLTFFMAPGVLHAFNLLMY